MKSLKYITVAVSFLLIVSCSESGKKETKNETVTTTRKVYPVKVEKIKYQDIERSLDYTANLVAFKEIHYAPASPGRIDKINVEVGNHVQIGQVLVELDRTQLNQAQTQLATAKSSFQRIDTLYQLGSISEQQYEQVKTQYELALTNVQFLKKNTTLLSPINGIVTCKYFEEGEFYSGVPNTQAGKAAIISLMQINPLKAVVSVSQSYFPEIKEGMLTKVTTDVYPDKTFIGTINKVYPVIDQNTRTFKVDIVISNPNEILRPGMFARIELMLKKDKALVVPAISILKQEGTNNRFIFINNNNVAKQLNVNVEKQYNEKIELSDDAVKEGMLLIVEGQANLKDGDSLKVVSE